MNARQNRMKAALAAATVAVATTALSEAAVIAVNFGGDGYGVWGGPVTSTAFGVDAANWTVASDSETNPTALVGGVAFSGTSVNDWAQASVFPAGGDAAVFYGYMDDSTTGAKLSITGLSAWLLANAAPAYSVQVIQSSDGATGFSSTSVFTSNGGTSLGTLTNGTVQATNGPLGGASSVLSGLSSDTLYLNVTNRAGSVRGTLSGVILTTVPEPGTTVTLGALGALGLLRRRRA